MERVDARGKTCPLPVIETKKVLESMTEGTVEVLVDNAIAVQNLCKMAEQKKMKAVSEKQSEDCYVVTITVEARCGSGGLYARWQKRWNGGCPDSGNHGHRRRCAGENFDERLCVRSDRTGSTAGNHCAL